MVFNVTSTLVTEELMGNNRSKVSLSGIKTSHHNSFRGQLCWSKKNTHTSSAQVGWGVMVVASYSTAHYDQTASPLGEGAEKGVIISKTDLPHSPELSHKFSSTTDFWGFFYKYIEARLFPIHIPGPTIFIGRKETIKDFTFSSPHPPCLMGSFLKGKLASSLNTPSLEKIPVLMK